MKKTLILGATTNELRYAYKAAEKLNEHNHLIVPVGIKKGNVFGKEIINSKEIQLGIDTITMYIGPKNQEEWYDYILETQPKRVLFNPGTENLILQHKLQDEGIDFEEACTLVLLNLGEY